MNTEVIMKRPIFDGEVKQKSKSEFLSSTDLVKLGNRWRAINLMPQFDVSDWINTKQTKEFINELEKQFGTVYIAGRGRGNDSWMHPYLFIDLALAISPTLKIEVYKWMWDELLKYRNLSGDSYRLMVGVLWDKTTNKALFQRSMIKLADTIKIECGVENWQNANQKQLALRDKIHENIALLAEVMTNTCEAIRLGIEKAKKHNSIS